MLTMELRDETLTLVAPRNLLRGVRLTALDVFDYCREHGRATISKRPDGLRELRVSCRAAPRSLELLTEMLGEFFCTLGDEFGVEPVLTSLPSVKPAA